MTVTINGDGSIAGLSAGGLPNDCIQTAQIEDNAVRTEQIGNNQITGAKIELGSDAAGDIMYYNGTDYVRLGKGTNGHYLKQGTSNAPEWGAVTTGITAAHDGVVKVWCNFRGNSSVSIRDHLNVDSITDDNTGTYTVNFDTDFATVNFVAVVSGGHSGNSSAPRGFETVYNMQVGSVKMDFRNDTGSESDPQVVSVICIGDQ